MFTDLTPSEMTRLADKLESASSANWAMATDALATPEVMQYRIELSDEMADLSRDVSADYLRKMNPNFFRFNR
jgi:hypothetical protein